MNDVYAFLRGKAEEVDKFFKGQPAEIEKQTLREHVAKAMGALDEMKYSKVWRYAVKLFEDEDLVEEHLKTIVLFHDIGKIFYQANIYLDKEKNLKYLNFRGHEYFSTYLADIYLWSEDPGLDRLLTLSAILYHHHAMGLKGRGRVRKLRICKTMGEYDFICRTTSDIIKSYGLRVDNLIRYLKDLKVDSNSLVVFDYVDDVYREVSEINRKIWHRFVGDRAFRKKMLSITVILQICDYEGSVGRTKRSSKFHSVLREFIELYRDPQ